MFFVFRSRELVLSALLVVTLLVFHTAVRQDREEGALRAVMAPVVSAEPVRTVVIDAGHGGEDGGALSGDGTREAGINLAVALRLQGVMDFLGVPAVMTRQEDISLHDPGLSTIRQQKTSDLKNRVEIVNAVENGLLISIHQNSLPSVPSVHGAQVFYNGSGEALALTLQELLNGAVNTHREKAAKPAPPEIYLMKHAACPAVLVECGFLSNAAETRQLTDPVYQGKLALMLAAGYLRWAEAGAAEE